jgi:hypothetical protein
MAEAPATAEPSVESVAEAKPVRRTRATKAKSADEPAAATEAGAEAAPAKATRSRTTKAATAAKPRAAKAADADAPKKHATRRKTTAAAPAEEA